MRKEDIQKICNAVEALTIVYEPLYYEDYDYLLDKYFCSAYQRLRDDDLLKVLDALVQMKIIYRYDDWYAVTDNKNIKKFNKNVTKVFGDISDIPFKEFKSGNEILKYRKLCDAKGIKGLDKLHTFFDGLEFNSGVDIKSTRYEFFAIPQLMADLEKYCDILALKCKPFDKKELIKLYENIMPILPRGFLRGHSFNEINEMIKEELESATYITEEIPKHKKKTDYTYEECISLLNELDNTDLYKIVDSDRVIELSINGKEVYCQLLGHFSGDKAVLVFEDRDEMLYSESLMKSDVEEIPDIAFRVSHIDCVFDGDGFVSDEMYEIINKNHYPTSPVLCRLKPCKKPRLVNKKEINLIGVVLNDLLSLTKLVDKNTIELHLGEEEHDILDTINQVYVYEDKVLFGEYEDDDIGIVEDKTKIRKIDHKLINKIKRCNNKHDISIGIFIYPISETEVSYFYQIYDETIRQMIEMKLIPNNEINDISNTILKELIKHDIDPNVILVNNDITYDMLAEYEFYFDEVDIDDTLFLNYLYRDMIGGSFEEEFDQNNKLYS